jgi:uncharacterized membrane protein
MSEPRANDDRAFAMFLGHALRAGVLFAAVIVAAGAAVFLSKRGAMPADYKGFHGEPGSLRSIRGIVAGAWTGDGQALIQAGLLVLIGTPVARVVFSVVAFTRERDWLYVVITAVVLGLLGFSLLVA